MRKWLGEAEAAEPRYRRARTPGKLAVFEATVVGWLEADARRPKRERRTAQAVLTQLKAQGFEGGYTILTVSIRDWRHRNGTNNAEAGVRAAEVRTGRGVSVRLERRAAGDRRGVAHLKLCASHAFLLLAYPSQAHEMLFDAHTRSFEALGGIARRGIYDKMF